VSGVKLLAELPERNLCSYCALFRATGRPNPCTATKIENAKVLMRKKESIRYFENAKEILSKSPVEEDRYADIKCVQEACGTAYLAVLKAVDEYLLKKGISKPR
jgi:hypothetical protein